MVADSKIIADGLDLADVVLEANRIESPYCISFKNTEDWKVSTHLSVFGNND